MRRILAACLILSGCAPGADDKGPARPLAEKPEVSAYKKAAAAYLDECRGLTKAGEAGFSVDDFRSKLARVKDLYTRLPSPPAGFGQLHENMHQLTFDLETLGITHGTAVRYGGNSIPKFHAFAKKQAALVESLEKQLAHAP